MDVIWWLGFEWGVRVGSGVAALSFLVLLTILFRKDID